MKENPQKIDHMKITVSVQPPLYSTSPRSLTEIMVMNNEIKYLKVF